MGRIKRLPESIANKIAAGEVIERPASVVKELIENSIDAESTRISIEVKSGGVHLMRIVDNGTGMNRDDALLALEHHSTSKLSLPSDLERINTFGFRGEALPSIAAVSRCELITRERDAQVGTRMMVEGGRVKDIKDIACQPGTSVSVTDLFYNMPARRKYLRTYKTEFSQIANLVTLVAIGHPEIGFEFVNDGKEIYRMPPTGELGLRIAEVYGHTFLKELIPVAHRTKELLITGFVSRPSLTRSTRAYQFFLVNHRNIHSAALSYSLYEAYRTLIPEKRHPVTFLFIEIDPGRVDVNIHPAKKEVKFLQTMSVQAAVTEAVREALRRKDLAVPLKPLPEETRTTTPQTFGDGSSPPTDESKASRKRMVPVYRERDTSSQVQEAEGSLLTQTYSGSDEETRMSSPGKVLGQTQTLYLVAEAEDGIFIIDQHAAHERILYEAIMESYSRTSVDSQGLLLPVIVELSCADFALFDENRKQFTTVGFAVEDFGATDIKIDAIPPYVSESDIKTVFLDVLEGIKELGKSTESDAIREKIAMVVACHSSVRAHDSLTPPELESLVRRLKKTKLPYTCPHGRPTMLKISYRELARRFRRT